MKAAFVHCPELEQYPYPRECPFSSARAGMTRRTLASMGLLHGSGCSIVAPAAADRATMETFHSARYLDALVAAEAGSLDLDALRMGIGTAETPVFKGLNAYAALACGATLQSAELVMSGQADVAFNPSGGYHHAHRERAGGFCYINDIVLACRALAESGRRVLFLDVDAHHCDGVQAAFWRRSDVMVVSFHESGKTLFPGTGFEDEIGAGEGTGYTVNLPLPERIHDEAYLRAYRAIGVPLIEAYAPDVIVLELGMDALAGDPLTHMSLSNNAYADVIESVLGFGRPIVATGGGGYHLENTVRGWSLAWTVLSGQDSGDEDAAAGMGGVLLETTDWHGGLRDRMLPIDPAWGDRVDAAVDATIGKIKENVFSYHGL